MEDIYLDTLASLKIQNVLNFVLHFLTLGICAYSFMLLFDCFRLPPKERLSAQKEPQKYFPIRTHFAVSSQATQDQRLKKRATDRAFNSQSSSANSSKASFLDLPPEIRNNIYSRTLLLSNDYVRLTPKKPTKIPELAYLLRTCKQIHDEVASLFYASHSFYCSFEDSVDLWTERSDIPIDLSILKGVYPKGITFPAPRYHQYMTRITIDIKINFQRLHLMDFSKIVNPRDHVYWEFSRMQELELDVREVVMDAARELDVNFEQWFKEIEGLWREKEGAWNGKGLFVQDVYYGHKFTAAVTFVEEERERGKGSLVAWGLG